MLFTSRLLTFTNMLKYVDKHISYYMTHNVTGLEKYCHNRTLTPLSYIGNIFILAYCQESILYGAHRNKHICVGEAKDFNILLFN